MTVPAFPHAIPMLDRGQVPVGLGPPGLGVCNLLLFDLLPPHNDREYRDPELMDRITASIEERGFLQPIRVVKEGDKYRVACGWTRVLCGRRAGKTHVPAIVTDHAPDEADDIIEKLIENECRGGTNPLDRAAWCLKVMKLRNVSRGEVARLAHLSPSQVTKDLSQFERLIQELKDRLYDGTLCPRGGYQLSRLSPEQQREAWPKVADMKADTIEDYVNGILGKRPKKPQAVKGKTPRGLGYILPTNLETGLAEAEALVKAIRKAIALQLSPSSVESLLKTA